MINSAAAVLLLVGASASTQPQACEILPDPQMGHWALYQVQDPEIGTMDMRMAIVGREEVDGEPRYWVEMKMSTPQGEMIMQVLVPRYPYDAADISQMIMKGPGQPAMRMPEQMLGMMREQAGGPGQEMTRVCDGAEMVGKEGVTVQAGSFDTEHYRFPDESTNVWVSREIPFGVVRMDSPDTGMELKDHGTDAESSIPEIPKG